MHCLQLHLERSAGACVRKTKADSPVTLPLSVASPEYDRRQRRSSKLKDACNAYHTSVIDYSYASR